MNRAKESIVDGASVVTPLLDTREASALLRVSERTITRLVKDGELRAVHVRGAVRFRAEDLAEFVARASS